jgi:outer membrane protein OmpA-like peptidoglycan-associated protein
MCKFHIFPLLAALALSSIVFAAEQALPEQLQKIEALQSRADILALGSLGSDNYHLAKARTWLDMALSEYHENEQVGIVPAVISQIEFLLDALESNQAGITMDTPRQITGSEAVRPDLWDKIVQLKSSTSFDCGQRPIAEAEVHLVWAGHEKFESSWLNAQTYVRSAEELLRVAQAKIRACELEKNPPVMEKITLSSDALFEFGDARLSPSAQWRLGRLADHIRQEGARLQEVVLVGHTDRLRSDGHHERNQILSEQRAESIRQYLIAQGIPEDKIQAIGAGSSQPLVECPTGQSKVRQIACLTPNRRVEIILRGVK